MLRESAQASDVDVDFLAIGGDAASADDAVEFGAELIAFAEAVATGEAQQLVSARDRLARRAGAAVLVDAAGVAANFQRMVRIADATGIPYDDPDSEVSTELKGKLELDRFATAAHTLSR